MTRHAGNDDRSRPSAIRAQDRVAFLNDAGPPAPPAAARGRRARDRPRRRPGARLHAQRDLPATRGARARGGSQAARAQRPQRAADRRRAGARPPRRAAARRRRGRRGRGRRRHRRPPGRRGPGRRVPIGVPADRRARHRGARPQRTPASASRRPRSRSRRACPRCAASSSTWSSATSTRAMPRPVHADLRREPLVREQVRLVMPEDHPLARRRRVPLARLADAEWAACQPGTGHREMHIRVCRRAGRLRARPALRVGRLPDPARAGPHRRRLRAAARPRARPRRAGRGRAHARRGHDRPRGVPAHARHAHARGRGGGGRAQAAAV